MPQPPYIPTVAHRMLHRTLVGFLHASGLSEPAVARRMGVSRQYVNRFVVHGAESGANLTFRTIEKFADAIDMDVTVVLVPRRRAGRKAVKR